MFLDNGYLDINLIMQRGDVLNIVIGARGTGKTYGAIKWCIENRKKFILMRRTKDQAELCSKPEFSPIIPVITDLGMEYELDKKIGKGMIGIKIDGELFCIVIGLTGISNLRGFNAGWVDMIIFDEFIGEAHERPIKSEDEAFFNAYETLNRNRELQGCDPIRVLMLANSNKVSSVYLAALGLMPQVEKMINSEREIYEDKQKGIFLAIVKNSPISKRKAKTALYQFTTDKYNSMAISNEFSIPGREFIKPQKSGQLLPVCSWGALYFYKIKGARKWYVNMRKLGYFDQIYADDTRGSDAFLMSAAYDNFSDAYLEGRVWYENLETLNLCNIMLKH